MRTEAIDVISVDQWRCSRGISVIEGRDRQPLNRPYLLPGVCIETAEHVMKVVQVAIAEHDILFSRGDPAKSGMGERLLP